MTPTVANEPNPAVVNQWLTTCVRQMTNQKNFATGGIETAHRHIHDITHGRCVFSVADPSKFVDFGAGEVILGETSIRFMHWESETDCQKSTHRPPDRHRVILHYVLRGEFDAIQDDEHVHVRAGEVLVVGATGTTIKRWHGACDLLIVSISRDALARALADEFGVDGVVRFDGLTVMDLADMATLTRFIATVVSDLSETPSIFSEPRLALQAERTLHLLFLKSLARRYLLGEGAAAIAPFYVRRAESYIRGHLDRAVTIEGLSAAAGVSPRTLHHGFRVYRHSSPMKYLKQARLTAARELLLAHPGRRIGDIASRYGYISLSHFSRDYKTLFGENPTDTVRRS
jgi:AraC-like DNA-binding protein